MTMNPISRRTVLKGVGVSLALPLLDAMVPGLEMTSTLLAAERTSAPKRMAFLYVPNGINMEEWTPTALGANFELPSVLRPLQSVKDDMLVLSGLTLDKARANGDGGGDHARAMSSFLTGCQPRKTHGADIQVGQSIDQVAARAVGRATRFPSLEIGCEGGRLAGNCDSGYSCAYSSNLSWRTPSAPNPKEINPRQVFDRLFGNQNRRETVRVRTRREQYNRSILDFVKEDANRLRTQLGTNDQRRLEEYLTGVREIEGRITAANAAANGEDPSMPRPAGVPRDFGEHIRLMADLMVLAFQTDLTRIGTFVFANEGSNRSYRMINVREGHHSLSHHQGRQEKLEQIKKINIFHTTQLAYMIRKMKAIREGEGTLLDNSMVVYGSGNSDGNRHNHDELPILLFGKGSGTINPGRHVRYPRETPLMNLYLTMLDKIGVEGVQRHGDSTGRLPYLG
ncbi:MAG: DUF1552 domain-containing protein [Gemmataceae bacterium]